MSNEPQTQHGRALFTHEGNALNVVTPRDIATVERQARALPDLVGECRIREGHTHAFSGPHRFNESQAERAVGDAPLDVERDDAEPHCTCPPPAGVTRNHKNGCALFSVRAAYQQGYAAAIARLASGAADTEGAEG